MVNPIRPSQKDEHWPGSLSGALSYLALICAMACAFGTTQARSVFDVAANYLRDHLMVWNGLSK